MGLGSKFANAFRNAAQGISNKIGQVWEGAKGVASKFAEGAKNAASAAWGGIKKAGQWALDHAEQIAPVVGGIAGAALGSYAGPEAVLAAREGIGGLADALPDGRVKDTLLALAWKKRSKPAVEPPPKPDLTQSVPGTDKYQVQSPPPPPSLTIASSGNFEHKATGVRAPLAIQGSGYDSFHVPNTSHPIYTGDYKKKSNKRGGGKSRIPVRRKPAPKKK